ncbi:MAG: hypothetical protein KF812_02510 [Fimbriimonadaceae bacterium]|nr:hypothetical protein [Fimbriimonadaceae bacterium]
MSRQRHNLKLILIATLIAVAVSSLVGCAGRTDSQEEARTSVGYATSIA